MRAATRRGLGVLIAIVLALNVACASAPPDRVALDTLATLQKTTAAAMQVANDLFVSGQITEAQVRNLIVLYDQYVAVSKLAGTALLAIASQGVPPTQAQIDQIMAPVKEAAAKVKVP